MIWLNESDIRSVATFSEWVQTAEEAMCAQEMGLISVPQRMHLDQGDNTLLVMPAISKERIGCKVVSLFPGNRNLGLPALFGLVMLLDGQMGMPLAILEGKGLTAMRTGAVGAAGIHWTTPDSVTRLGIVGVGVQGIQQAIFACHVRDFSEIRFFDPHPEARRRAMTVLTERFPEKRIVECALVDILLQESEVIITATHSREPVLPDDEDLLRGKHFIGIGSYKPQMREFPKSLFLRLENLFVDTLQGLRESGDLIDPVDQGWLDPERIRSLGSKLISGELAREPARPPTLFKSVGGAQFDLAAADLVYRKALESGLGTRLPE